MKISATSALVLNWSASELWTERRTKDYLNNLDLSEGDALLKLFDDYEHYMHMQAVSGRKYFVLKMVKAFLNRHENKNTQVVILGAGIAPISVEIASHYPNTTVFDVDRYLMFDKENLINGNPSNIKFIECDITDTVDLNARLFKNGFIAEVPAIVLMEGIIYYINDIDLLKILKLFKQYNAAFAIDYCVKPELVNKNTRLLLTEVFRKIASQIKISPVQFYELNEMKSLFTKAGYETVFATTLKEIQTERTGNSHPFEYENYSWIDFVYAE